MRKILVLLLCVGLWGCGLSPAYWRTQSDYVRVSNISICGASKSRVKMMFGKPDSKEVLDDKSEIWLYKNRQDGRTIRFIFNPRGAVKMTSILPNKE